MAAPRITNPKVATLEPTWRRYRGVSVLFDNPGTPTPPGVCALTELPVDNPPRQRLYDELADLVAEVDTGQMRDRYGFCPLPRNTYHVTVCEGPNERSAADVPGAHRAAVASVLDELPGSLDRMPTALRFLRGAELPAAVAANPVTFGAAGIVIWGHVLAARLEPADAPARLAIERLRRARADLDHQLRDRLGLGAQPWRPHVSLGYFANRAGADAAARPLAQWNRSLAARPRPTITFTSAAVYGFTDMVSFFRLGS